MDIYIYYDVPAANAPGVRDRVTAMQASLGDCCGARRLMRRPEARADGTQTWMEVYADVDASFDERLRSAVDAAGVTASTGARHEERFIDLRCA